MIQLTDHKGIALPIVLVLVAIMLLLAITIVSVIDNDSKTVNVLNDSEEALHIAEAGYNKYLWLLNNDTYFYQFGESKEDGFQIESTYDGEEYPQWDGYTKAYKEMEYRSGNALLGYFKIEIIPPTVDNPVVGVKSTGRTADGESQRTIYVENHKRAFTNHVLFENGEGEGIPFSSESKIKGPYYTNGDLLAFPGAEFFDSVGYVGEMDADGAIFAKEPLKMSPLQMPATNVDLTKWGNPDIGGYTYTGMTSILLNGKTMKIRQRDGTLLENVTHPESGVIYIQSIRNSRGDLYISGVLDGRLTIIADGDIYICAKDPTENTIGNSSYRYRNAHNYQGITYTNQNIPIYNHKDLDNISDDMLGLVTDNDIIIHNFSNNWPVACTHVGRNTIFTAVENLKIQAALYCRTIKMQYLDYFRWYDINLGQIHYTGSRVTRYTSATGYVTYYHGHENHTGYSSDSCFDYRMSYDAPPHFTEPINSGWEVKSWREISP